MAIDIDENGCLNPAAIGNKDLRDMVANLSWCDESVLKNATYLIENPRARTLSWEQQQSALSGRGTRLEAKTTMALQLLTATGVITPNFQGSFTPIEGQDTHRKIDTYVSGFSFNEERAKEVAAEIQRLMPVKEASLAR